MAKYPEPEPALDHSTMMSMVLDNAQTCIRTDFNDPTLQLACGGSIEAQAQLESLKARTHEAEEVADKLLDDLTAVQGRLQQALADNNEKNTMIRSLEVKISELEVAPGSHSREHATGQDATTQSQVQPQYGVSERGLAGTVAHDAAIYEQNARNLALLESYEAKVRELERLVQFFKRNSEQSAMKVKALQEENRRLRSTA